MLDDWIYIRVPQDAFVASSRKSYKIAMPHNCDLRGYCIWFPRKLTIGNDDLIDQIYFNKSYTFRALKYGQGKFNRYEVLDERMISGEELAEILSDYQFRPLIHKPEKLEPVKTEPLPELLDED